MIAIPFADQTVLSVFFCVVQVTILAVIGTLVTHWLIPRRPELAATVSCMAVAIIMLLTIAVPFSVPRCLVFEPRAINEHLVVNENVVEGEHASGEKRRGSTSESVPTTGLMIDIPDVILRAAMRVKSDHAADRSISMPSVALALLGFGCIVGFVRFGLSIVATLLLTRRTQVLTDDRVLQWLMALRTELDVRQSVRVFESDVIASAAVYGSIRPRILLPSDWRDWSDAELRSVLAHELAHVTNGDFAWRAVSAAAGAMHYFNPFVHQLARSMVLAQELTADVVATKAVQRTTYIRSLSALALRRDQSDAGCNRVGISPVFSGFLIRRINMLYGNEDFGLQRSSAATRFVVVGAVILCGMILFTIRGYAEPPLADAPSESRNADEPIARIARASRTKSIVDPIEGLFQRRSVNSADIEENKFGMFEVRVAELLSHKDLAPLVVIVNRGIAGELKHYFELDENPHVDLRSIDDVYGSAHVIVRKRSEEATSRLMFGTGTPPTRVKFRGTNDAESWIKKHVSGTVERQLGDETYLELPAIPAFGPASILVKRRDPSTICFGSMLRVFDKKEGLETEKRAREFLDSVRCKPQKNQSPWAKPFDQVRGGLLTIAFTNEGVDIPEAFSAADQIGAELECGRIIHRMLHTFETFSMGLDINEQGTRLGIRVHISAADEARREIIVSDVQALMRIARQHLAMAKGEVDQEIDDRRYQETGLDSFVQFLDHMIVRREEQEDGLPYVAIRSDIEIPSLEIVLASLFSADMIPE